MSSTTHSNNCKAGSFGPCFLSTQQKWSVVNIAGMVLGFVLFWPLGLAMLFWILSGRDVVDLPAVIRSKWAQFRGNHSTTSGNSDNVIFNEYQQTQRDRIQEIEEEIRKRETHFREYRDNANRQQDRREFDDFMSSSPIDQ